MVEKQEGLDTLVEGKPFFDPKLFLGKVGTGKTRAELRHRQIVFSQGAPADAVYYIEKGRIELRVLSQQGKEAILASLGAGDFFGEACIAGHRPLRIATAVAAAECSIMRLEKSAMIAVLRDEPVFSALFHLIPANPWHPQRRRSRRSVVQFERKTLGAPSTAVGQFR